jgi:hypothetical protein
MDVVNATPFAAHPHLFLDASGRERLLVVVKATWSIAEGKARLAERQALVFTADRYRGPPERSSLAEAFDLAPLKPATDVLLSGYAYTSAASRAEVVVAFRLGQLKKGLRVVGDRVWQSALGMARPSAPRPFERMEVAWERAFGGIDASVPGRLDLCEENPAGVGFRGRGSALPIVGATLPNLETATEPIRSPSDRPTPAGLGPIGPHWRARARHAGTYDATWRLNRYPFLPEDFNPAFYQVAPADQIYPGHLRGGEPMTVAGMTPEGSLSFALPRLAPHAAVEVGNDRLELPPGACDTVLVDCEQRTLSIVWRTAIDVHGKVAHLRAVELEPGDSDVA